MELWRKNLYILWATQFLAMAGMNLVVPFLPFYIRELGVTEPDSLARWSGVAFAGPFFLAFLTIPIWGALGDRYGRKIMVVRAIFGLALSQALIGLAQDPLQLVAFRIVQGGISGFIASSLALVSTSTPRQHIGYALGFMQSSTAAGMVLGPFVGGVLADLIGYREIFFVTATLCALGGIVVLTSVREGFTRQPEAPRFSALDNLRLMLTDPRLRIIAVTLIAGQMSVLMIEPIFALFVESFQTGSEYLSTLTGAVFSIAGLFMVISAPWWGKRNDRLGHKRNLVLGLAVVGFAYAGHLLVQNLIQLGILRAVLGFARGGFLPSLYALTSIYAPAERRGGIMAIASSMTILGNMAGPIIGGSVAGHYGIWAAFVLNSCLLLVASLFVWRYFHESPAGTSAGSATPSAPVTDHHPDSAP